MDPNECALLHLYYQFVFWLWLLANDTVDLAARTVFFSLKDSHVKNHHTSYNHISEYQIEI